MLLISNIQNLIKEIQSESEDVDDDHIETRKDIFFRLNDNNITANDALAELNENSKKFGQKDTDQIVKL